MSRANIKETLLRIDRAKLNHGTPTGGTLAGSMAYGLAGGRTKHKSGTTSDWISHVKDVAAKKKLPYGEALKVASKTWKKAAPAKKKSKKGGELPQFIAAPKPTGNQNFKKLSKLLMVHDI